MPTPARPASASLVDPEDDLPSDTYAGDFETTLIPHFDPADSGSVRSSSSGIGLIGSRQEPLPYQPQPRVNTRFSRPTASMSTSTTTTRRFVPQAVAAPRTWAC